MLTFAKVAKNCKENLQNVIAMIDKRFNDLANWDNPTNDRYSVKLEIVSIDIDMEGKRYFFPALDRLKILCH